MEGVQRQERELLDREEHFLQQATAEQVPSASVSQVVAAFRQDRPRFLHIRRDGILSCTLHAYLSCFAVFTAAVVVFPMFLHSSPPANAPAPVAYPPNSSYIQSIVMATNSSSAASAQVAVAIALQSLNT